MTTWDDVDLAVGEAIADGHIADYRGALAEHHTKRFRQRLEPSDILGVCTHHSANTNQDPRQTAEYHVGPNHMSASGCPGFCYTAAISDHVEEGKIILCRDFRDITWSQATDGRGNWSGDENRHLIATLVMGDFDENGRHGKSGDPSDSQILRWQWWTSWLEDLFGFDGLGYFCHAQFGKVHCPGRLLRLQTQCRRTGLVGLRDDKDWQQHLLRWDPACLPRFGADGHWGYESKRALVAFELAHKHRADGIQDPFTELLLLRKFPVTT